MRVLILHPGALGDIILSLPAIGILRDRYTGARITLAANTDFTDAVASGYADQTLSLSALPLHRLYRSDILPSEDALFWRSFDRIVSWTGSDAALFASKLEQHHPCSLVASWKPDVDEPRHVSRLFVDSLGPWLPCPRTIPRPEIRVDMAARARGQEWLRAQGLRPETPIVAIHPGAGSIAKRWPPARYRELIRRLCIFTNVLVVEGPAEPGLGREIVSNTGPNSALASCLPLPLLAAVLSGCRTYVGNDSGIAHLAAGLAVACVVLFGPTPPRNWAPIGSHVTVLQDIGGCAACAGGQGMPHSCLENISSSDVFYATTKVVTAISDAL